jgi:hypothetical protein
MTTSISLTGRPHTSYFPDRQTARQPTRQTSDNIRKDQTFAITLAALALASR